MPKLNDVVLWKQNNQIVINEIGRDIKKVKVKHESL